MSKRFSFFFRAEGIEYLLLQNVVRGFFFFCLGYLVVVQQRNGVSSALVLVCVSLLFLFCYGNKTANNRERAAHKNGRKNDKEPLALDLLKDAGDKELYYRLYTHRKRAAGI